MDAALASNIVKKQRFRADDLNADDEYDFDRGIDMYERKRGDQVQQPCTHVHRSAGAVRRGGTCARQTAATTTIVCR